MPTHSSCSPQSAFDVRITLVISSLSCGGAERVMSMMANYWASEARVTVITLDSDKADFFRLSDEVNREALGLAEPMSSFVSAIRKHCQRLISLRRAVRRSSPDVVISFLDITNVTTLISTAGLGVPVIVSERSDPRRHHIGWLWRVMRRYLYRHAAAVVVQTVSVRTWAQCFVRSDRIIVIPNPVQTSGFDVIVDETAWTAPSGFVVAVGRLRHEKGFDLLLQAYSRIRHKIGRHLVILGDGPERESLERMALDLGVADSVHMPGSMVNPEAIMRKAGMFVLSSRYEGFPNALVEAMSCGLPVVSVDCDSGPREIITNNVDGVLVPFGDVDALAKAMEDVLADDRKRASLGASAARIKERFSLPRVMERWEELISTVAQKAINR